MNAILLVIQLAGVFGVAAPPLFPDRMDTARSARGAVQMVAAAIVPRANAQDAGANKTEGRPVAADNRNSGTDVFWTFSVTIESGKLHELENLIREMADASQANEPGTLIYEWTISADKTTAEVHERYADSEAALRHLASFNDNYADRLMALVAPTGMTVYGTPSADLKKELAGADPVYMNVLGGFAR